MIPRNSLLALRVAAFLVMLVPLISLQAQQGGLNRPTMRDRVRAITQADMDRQLLLNATLPVNKEAEESRKTIWKQIREDFKELQGLNNKMMADVWARPSLDYGFVSDMVSRIRGKASRLKMNLNLPQPESSTVNHLSSRAIINSNDFRAELMALDKTIMSFVSNPIFQKPNTIEIKQGADARRALETVIDLTDDLKKSASRLSKVSPSP
ncbi:MAG TPA: hypothetical protein VHR36_11475 [Pyrinomonadaceae bacterium]|nr:hypothetical protein [Pyrinomonadaceae bacterium]